jgi:hypothetical protein
MGMNYGLNVTTQRIDSTFQFALSALPKRTQIYMEKREIMQKNKSYPMLVSFWHKIL